MRRARRREVSALSAGVGLIAGSVLAVYLAFAGLPFGDAFRLRAVVVSGAPIQPGSPVRIAGVDVGEVTRVRATGGDAAVVEMEIDDAGLPVHADAELKIRPRIFLEGNFFVDLMPGSPGAETLGDGATLPAAQTASPVQFDEVLSALRQDTREDLRDLLAGYSTALTRRPGHAEDATQDRVVQRQSAAAALNDATREAPGALRSSAVVAEALRGRPGDVARLIAGLDGVARGLGRDRVALRGSLVGLNRTLQVLAEREEDVRATVRRLPAVLRRGDDGLRRIAAALPPTSAFARAILPGLRETPATITAALPWIRETRGLLRDEELPALSRELSAAMRDTARTTDVATMLMPRLGRVARCATLVVLPTGDIRIDDGPLSTGVENYKELWYSMVGLAGESQGFDGNGQYVRFHTGGGSLTVKGRPRPGQAPVFGNAVLPPRGTRPAFPGTKPAFRDDVPCHTQPVPAVNAAPTGAADGSGG